MISKALMRSDVAPLSLRRATVEDADAIAAVFSSSFSAADLPLLHTPAEDRRFIEEVILRQCKVTLADQAV